MTSKYIFIRGERYYLYSKHYTWQEAYKQAQHEKKTNKKNKYYILIEEKGIIAPYKTYNLYLNKTIKLW